MFRDVSTLERTLLSKFIQMIHRLSRIVQMKRNPKKKNLCYIISCSETLYLFSILFLFCVCVPFFLFLCCQRWYYLWLRALRYYATHPQKLQSTQAHGAKRFLNSDYICIIFVNFLTVSYPAKNELWMKFSYTYIFLKFP